MPGMGITHGLAISRQHVALLAPSSSGARSHPCNRRTDNALKVRFLATVGEELEIEGGWSSYYALGPCPWRRMQVIGSSEG